ncbi:HetP family heterocyst commitment protein [Cronbergia sp. UHCC 0137]|uniref:HetP family heterocyst commitment protein n=1 Tax=Cronbergia sp. UHCC 0137 TaxID=3110239 RepID=UPI002B2096A1|nr:HetP family heterocyst commitment protein [Cronbergia sp. UHCC 0137]MEA5618828.1 HetP family heterocyst commitment protein [Cronbergia sp. UHCC 0137]
MTEENFEQNEQLNKILKREELQKIIKAIILGKYSWACTLLLHFIGYNPLEYIPYRTYSRLIKNNSPLGETNDLPKNKQKLDVVKFETSWNLSEDYKHTSN